MSETTSPFGFKDLDPREKVSQVHGVFARVAGSYTGQFLAPLLGLRRARATTAA